jgi:pilus assembly protein CpaF
VSAFGKKPGMAPSRPSFGVARPMQGGSSGGGQPREQGYANSQPTQAAPSFPEGGDQFPPIDSVELPGIMAAPKQVDAMVK